jgi:hypothetical protein
LEETLRATLSALIDRWLVSRRKRRARLGKLYPASHFIYKLIAQRRGWLEGCDEDNLMIFLIVYRDGDPRTFEGPTAWKDIVLNRDPKKFFPYRGVPVSGQA